MTPASTSPRTLRPDMPDSHLDRMVATTVFGYAVTVGPKGHLAAHIGAGATAKLVDVPPVSSDIAAAWQAANVALDEGQADGFETSTLRPEGGPVSYRATFLRRASPDESTPICSAMADSMPRAICGALLALYEGADGRRVLPPSRSLQ